MSDKPGRIPPQGGSGTAPPQSKPFTPKAVARAGTGPTHATCADCRHWRERDAGLGQCTANPPSVVAQATAHGPLCLYPLTTADTPACGQWQPK